MMKKILLLLSLGLILAGCETIKYPACENDTHCKGKNSERPNEVCVNRECKECRADSDCSTGLLCKENQCKPECVTDSECDSPKICKAQKCQFECEADGDCAEGYQCKENKCEVKLECTQDIDCDAGLECRDNKCLEPIKISKMDTIPECSLERVHFDFNEYTLTSEARETLSKNAECIATKTEAIVVEGHCDDRGTEEYNLNLGQKRADSVQKYLKSLGVKSSIKSISKGEEDPLDSSSNEDAWSKNRRSEIIFK